MIQDKKIILESARSSKIMARSSLTEEILGNDLLLSFLVQN